MKNARVIMSALVVLVLAAPVAAQTTLAAPSHQSLGGGMQWTYPISGTYLQGTPGVNASWRYSFGPRLGVEGTFGWWRKRTNGEYHAGEFTTPNGVFHDPLNVIYDQRLSLYGAGMNVLGTFPAGRRVDVIVGGGPGLYMERASFAATIDGAHEAHAESGSHFGVQGLTEIEVHATDRVSLFGGVRMELRDVRYEDSGFVYPVAGVRIGF